MWTTILKTLKASRLLPTVVIAWGAVVLGNGFITNYAGLIACRLILGLLESALTPCLFLTLSLWYQVSFLLTSHILLDVDLRAAGKRSSCRVLISSSSTPRSATNSLGERRSCSSLPPSVVLSVDSSVSCDLSRLFLPEVVY
jgi:hypothetical protein